MKWLGVFILSMLLTSCFDLIEEVNFNEDGSGDFSYEINLGKYKFTLENIMKLDSIGRWKIPSQTDVSKDLKSLQGQLNAIEGVSGAVCEADFEYYIFRIKGKFKNVLALNKAYTTIYNFKRKKKETFIEAYKFDGKTFQRSEKEPKTNIFVKNAFLSENQFSSGKVMIVTRFKKKVSGVSNAATRVSKNGMAILTKCSAAQLMKNPSRINCSVNLK